MENKLEIQRTKLELFPTLRHIMWENGENHKDDGSYIPKTERQEELEKNMLKSSEGNNSKGKGSKRTHNDDIKKSKGKQEQQVDKGNDVAKKQKPAKANKSRDDDYVK